MNKSIITRKQYMDREVTHQEYYGQFVTEGIKRLVRDNIGLDRIIKSKDRYFNDIPLKEWDALSSRIAGHVRRSMNLSNITHPLRKGVTLSDTCCIAKAAARIHKEENI